MKMLKFLLPMLSAVLLLSGCDGGSAPTASQTQSTNPADIDNPLVNAKRTADKTIDVSYINQAINLFNVQEGRMPKTLEELVPKYVAKIPDAPLGYKLVYDAKKGEVSVVRE